MVLQDATRATGDRSRPAYTALHRALHWLVAAALVGVVVTALGMEDAEGAARDRLYILHWSFGVTIGLLMIARVASRLAAPPAPLDVPMPALQKRLAHTVHALLYVGLLLNPLIGYVAKSLYGGGVTFFFLFDIPALPWRDKALAEGIFAVHGFVGWAVVVLAAIHVGASLYHVVRGDDTLSRITTG